MSLESYEALIEEVRMDCFAIDCFVFIAMMCDTEVLDRDALYPVELCPYRNVFSLAPCYVALLRGSDALRIY